MAEKSVWKAPLIKKLEIKRTMLGSAGTGDASFASK